MNTKMVPKIFQYGKGNNIKTGRMIITSIKNFKGHFLGRVAYARKMDGYSMVALFRGRFIFLNDTECPVIIGTCQNCLEPRDAKEWVIKPNQKYLRNGVHQYTSGWGGGATGKN